MKEQSEQNILGAAAANTKHRAFTSDMSDDLDEDFRRALDFDDYVDELRQWVDPGPGIEYHEWMRREAAKQLGPGLPYWPKRNGTIYKQLNKETSAAD